MSVSSRRRPRRPTPRRSGGRSPAAASGRAGPPGRGRRCASGRAGRGAAGALCAGPRARPSWAGPGGCGALAAAAPGPAPFCWASGRAGGWGGREGGPGERGAPERPLCLPLPGGGGGGCWVRAAGDALSWAARAPASRARSGLALPRPAPRLQHAAIWRLARPGLAPKVGWEPWRFARWFQSLVLGGGWGRGRVCENKELPSTHRSFFWHKVLQQGCLV